MCTIIFAILFTLFIYFCLNVFRYWFAPIGKSLGIKSARPKKAAENVLLETAYNQSSRLNHKKVNILIGILNCKN